MGGPACCGGHYKRCMFVPELTTMTSTHSQSHLVSLSLPLVLLCLVLQRCVFLPRPLGTGLYTLLTQPEEVTLQHRQPSPAHQIQTQRPQKTCLKVNQQLTVLSRIKTWTTANELPLLPIQNLPLPLILTWRTAIHPPLPAGWTYHQSLHLVLFRSL